MYQTVGHQGIEFIAAAMELPLYRRETKGKSSQTEKHYVPQENDEVEDLFDLLTQVKVSGNDCTGDNVCAINPIVIINPRLCILHFVVLHRPKLNLTQSQWVRFCPTTNVSAWRTCAVAWD